MSKRLVSVMLLAVLLSGMFLLAYNIHPVKASETVYIRADGSIDPPTAPIQRNGDFYILTGNITNDGANATIVVEKNDIVVDGSGFTVEGSDLAGSCGVYLGGTNNVTIQNTKIMNFMLTTPEYGIWLSSSSGNSLIGNTIANNTYGILLESSSNNSIYGNDVTRNWSGILLDSSSEHNSINGNTITGNSNYGITLFNSSSNNSIYGNNMTSNSVCIWLNSYSDYNSVVGNNIANNGGGIRIWDSSYNSIVGNNVTNNSIEGITFDISSGYNSILENTIENNTVGIGPNYEHGGTGANKMTANVAPDILSIILSNNTFYHNNIITNSQQVNTGASGYANVWDAGYSQGGNYWSDYIGVDTNNDGMGDTPYVVDSSNQDNYPLMKPYLRGDINHDGTVDILDIVIVAAQFGKPPPPITDLRADVNGDGIVDIVDIVIIATYFGETI